MHRRVLALVAGLAILSVALSGSLATLGPAGAAVASSAPPKAKIGYFHNATVVVDGVDQLVMNTTLPAGQERVEEFTDASITFSWFLDPPLAGDLVLNETVRAFLWVRYLDAAGEGTTSLTLGLGLYAHKDGSTTTVLSEANNKVTHSSVTSHFSEYAAEGEIASAVTVEAGSRLEVALLLESNFRVTKRIAWGSDDFPSRAALPAVTHIEVDRVRALNETGGEPPYFESDDNVTFNVTITDPFGGYDIVWVNLTLEAPDGALLFDQESMVQTTGNKTSFASTFEFDWSDATKANGLYNVTVEAVDKTGFHFRFPDRPGDETFGGHLESRTVLLSLGEILWANFALQDTQADPLEGAVLELWDGTVRAASGTANATGGLNLTAVPGTGDYTARGYWQDTRVLEQTVTISGPVNEDEALVLTLEVYSPTLQVVDDARVPLADASVFLTHPNGTSAGQAIGTDDQGQFSLSRTAGGTYLLRILWAGSDVGVKAVTVSSNDVHVVLADVFYLTVRATDQADATVTGVHITVTDLSRALISDSKLTDAQGQTVSRLPRGTYKVEANWLGAEVGVANSLAVSANRTLDLRLSIFNVDLALEDQAGQPLEGATVEVTFQGFREGGTTGPDGELALQLPGGEVSLKIWWKDVLVFEGTRTVDAGNASLTVSARVFHIPVTVVDKDGNPLEGVSLTLYRDGVPVDGGITGPDGTVTFRQPEGSYRVVADLETTHLLTGVDQTAEATFSLPAVDFVEVRFAEFAPLVTSTNLFYVLLIVAALVGGLGFLLFYWKRGGRSPPPTPESPGEP